MKYRAYFEEISVQHFFVRIIFLTSLSLAACQSQPMQNVQLDEHYQGILGELEIHMLDMSYEPVKLDVPREGRYRIKVTNTSQIPHDIFFDNGVSLNVSPGETEITEIYIDEEGLAYHCSLPGHEQAGMKGKITVNGNSPEISHVHQAKLASSVFPEYINPAVPALQPQKIHDIALVAEEKEMAVAKDAVQNLWTFNGKVPGPFIHVKVGDIVRVHLINPSTNKLAHSVDFHSSQVAWNDEMRSINPGEDRMYEWKAEYAGVWMYHCGTNPALHHIASGMYGMVIVEPEKGLAPVDYEFALVQSEFYMGEPGRETDFHKAASGHPSPDYVVFNGVANQYKEHPIQVATGKKVRFYVLNAGPNEDSAFHIVGTIFKRVIKEGIELTADNKEHWGSQVVDLAPAQGAIVELTTAEDGLYPIVTHAFNFVGKGALGLLKAGDGDPLN